MFFSYNPIGDNMEKYGLIIAASVAIVAIVGMVLFFAGDTTGALTTHSFGEKEVGRCYLDHANEQMVCETEAPGLPDPFYAKTLG